MWRSSEDEEETYLDVVEFLPAPLQPTQQSQVRLLFTRRLQQSVID